MCKQFYVSLSESLSYATEYLSFVDRDMFMRYNGEGVGHCHNAFPSGTESVDEATSDDEMDIDHDDSVEGGAVEHKRFDSVEDLGSSSDLTDDDYYSGDGYLDLDNEADGGIDLDTLF